MSKFESIKIPRSEAWKYSNTFGTNGDDFFAKVLVNDDGSIAQESFSNQWRDKLKKSTSGKKGKEKQSSSSDSNKDGCLKKIFKSLWWLVKKLLKILLYLITFGIIHGDDNKK